MILFSDPPKPGVDKTIAELARQGIALKIITGDNDLVARHVAGQVGLQVDGVLTGDQMRTIQPRAGSRDLRGASSGGRRAAQPARVGAGLRTSSDRLLAPAPGSWPRT